MSREGKENEIWPTENPKYLYWPPGDGPQQGTKLKMVLGAKMTAHRVPVTPGLLAT